MNNIKEPPPTDKLLKKDGSDIRRMFASIAPTYDLLNRLLSMGFDRRWRQRAVELSGLSGPGELPETGQPQGVAPTKRVRVLDVCTGTADLAIAYSQKIGPGGAVVGSDFCWEMLVLAPEKLRALSPKDSAHITLVQADALSLPFPDNSFQVASVAFGIRNVSDLEGGIREMARVIRPGGRVVILEFGLPESRIFKMAYNFYFNSVLPRVGNLIAAVGSSERTRAYAYLPASVGEFPDARGLRRLMESLGLTDVKSYPLSMGIANVHVGKKPESDEFKEPLQFIQKLIDTGRKQQELIESGRKSSLYIPKAYVQPLATIVHTEKLYVEAFWDHVSFLKEKIETERDGVCSYYFSLTRILMETYAELSYLLEQDDNKKFGLCIAQYLFQLSQRYRYSKSANKDNLLKTLYESYYREYQADKLSLPLSIEDFSRNFLERSGFSFPNIEEITKKYLDLQDSATITKKLFPTLTSELIYNLHYRLPSDYLHGKIYVVHKTKNKPENERFWIISHVEILGFLFIELVDKKILGRETEKDLEQLSEEFKRICSNFVTQWVSRRESQNKILRDSSSAKTKGVRHG